MTAISIFKIMSQPFFKTQRSTSCFIKEIEEEAQCYCVEETPELLAAIDEGIRSLEQEGSVPFEVVKAQLQKKWDML